MATTSITVTETPLLGFVLRRADDALMLGHRLSEWIGHAPMLEEELALANIALDLIGQARSLYAYAGERRRPGTTRTSSPICATPGSSAICCWSSSRTAISPSPSCGSCSIRPSRTVSGGR